MKFFIINSFRMMVYVAYLATIAVGLYGLGYHNGFVEHGKAAAELATGYRHSRQVLAQVFWTLVAMSLAARMGCSKCGWRTDRDHSGHSR